MPLELPCMSQCSLSSSGLWKTLKQPRDTERERLGGRPIVLLLLAAPGVPTQAPLYLISTPRQGDKTLPSGITVMAPSNPPAPTSGVILPGSG